MATALRGGGDGDIVQQQVSGRLDQHQKAVNRRARRGFFGQHPKLAVRRAGGVILVQGRGLKPVAGDIGAIGGLGDGLAQQVEAFAGLRRQPDAHRLAGVVALDVRLDRG